MYIKLKVAHVFVRKWPIPRHLLFSDERAWWSNSVAQNCNMNLGLPTCILLVGWYRYLVCPFQSGLFNCVDKKLFIMLGSVSSVGVVEESGTAFQTPTYNVLLVLVFCPNILVKEDVGPL